MLFGPDSARQMAGDYLAFVVWFNFLAGFFYVAAGVGIWLGQRWGVGLAWAIAAASMLTALVFAVVIRGGAAFELRTVGALAFRIALWLAIALALGRPGRRA